MGIADEGSLGTVVRAERLRQNLDQRDLAARAQVGLSALRRLEAGQGSTLRTVLAVMHALDLPLDVPRRGAAPRRRAASLPSEPTGLTRREERTSWYLHRAVASKLRTGAREQILTIARENLAAMRAGVRGPQAHAWVDEWEKALNGPTSDLIALMLRTDTGGIDLRQVSPFAGALSQDERLAAIRRAVAA